MSTATSPAATSGFAPLRQTVFAVLWAATIIGNIGAALMAPTWQAIVPELVGKADLKSAVALNSLGIDIFRAIGPRQGVTA